LQTEGGVRRRGSRSVPCGSRSSPNPTIRVSDFDARP
jgi:hypothetical protein